MPDVSSELKRPLILGERLEIRPGRYINVTRHIGHVDEDRVLFFSHGSGGNQDQWRKQWLSLAAEGFHLVAWDLLGHGASDKPDHPQAYAWDELVADYLEVFQRYRGKRNVLVAHSFGTGLTLSALASLNQAGRIGEVQGALLLGTFLERPQRSGGIMSLPVWVLELLRPWLMKGFRELAWHATADPQLVAYEEGLTKSNPLYVFKPLMSQAQWPTLAQLDELALPVNILAGDSDGLTPANAGEALHKCLKNSRFKVLANCGHQLMLEKPDEVLQSLRELLLTATSETRHV
ncbi:alpha/beta hydrolase [Pseudomonas sp.]|uniref:alpha/beta fold hydrolase n=1 Tax=Pseudomonas sp. TaxID=306 RepID=UPI00261ED2C2|nr:alpha/beta hydrolase [Pseudomonas sp.]